MLFNSIEFAIFLPIAFVLYWFVFNRHLKAQNAFVLGASYVFYGWWDWRFLILIAIISLSSWLSGLLIERQRNVRLNGNRIGFLNRFSPKTYLLINILINIGILVFFKYYNFFVQSFVEAFMMCGIELHTRSLQVILPVGISFYTFQSLSYSIDVYKERLKPTRDVISFFSYVAFFPQLVAGPIERAVNLLPQFERRRVFEYDKAIDGCRQMLWGLFKKIVIADNCALYVDKVFATYQDCSGSTLLLGGILFAIQIYCDFSGYSDIAIGVARLFGFNLMRNFNYPYFSRDIAEFWRRWHISLTTWFRDYIYIPLGGSRTTKAKIVRNTIIVYLVSGLWHGANWTFVVWGLYNAILFIPLIVSGNNRKYLNSVAENRWLPTLKEFGQMVLTFLLAVFGWIIFRSDSLVQAWEYLMGIFSSSLFTMPWLMNRQTYGIILIGLTVLMVFEWVGRQKQYGIQIVERWGKGWRYMLFVVMIMFIIRYSGTPSAFIYFAF